MRHPGDGRARPDLRARLHRALIAASIRQTHHPMPTSKEEIRGKYNMTEEDYDVVVALALRPTCEHCNKALPPEAGDARICSFECTFCARCVAEVLGNVCPNCGGGFTPRPVRPVRNWRNNNYLGAIPACIAVKHKPVDATVHARFSGEIRKLAPDKR